jgi:hypothetical protein
MSAFGLRDGDCAVGDEADARHTAGRLGRGEDEHLVALGVLRPHNRHHAALGVRRRGGSKTRDVRPRFSASMPRTLHASLGLSLK